MISAVEREEFATLNSVVRDGFMEKVSFEQNPAGGEGPSLQVSGGGMFQERKRQVKRSCAWPFQSATRSSRMCREAWKAGRVRGEWGTRGDQTGEGWTVCGADSRGLVGHCETSVVTGGDGESFRGEE